MNASYHDQGGATPRWLLFFSRVPSRPVSSRMKVWRKLVKAGAVQLKGAVYVLPYSETHREFIQWLVEEVSSMGGEAAFVCTDRIETMEDTEIIALFDQHRETDYQALTRAVNDIDRKLMSIRKGTRMSAAGKLDGQLGKLRKEFDDIRRVDFFSSASGRAMKKKIDALAAEARRLPGTGHRGKIPAAAIVPRRPSDYRGKTWVTRKRPFVDRMSSAWLIRRFIDPEAAFRFLGDDTRDGAGEGMVSFDVRGGEFTHHGDLCTFEVMLRSFGLQDRKLRKIAEVVHAIDIRDDKYPAEEARGVEAILNGMRKTAMSDESLLEKGIELFEMLYLSKSG